MRSRTHEILGSWVVGSFIGLGIGASACGSGSLEEMDVHESSSSSRAGPVCGNRRVDAEEACDDGNVASGDGCSPDCLEVEPGWSCPIWTSGEGGACKRESVCGDGHRGALEECDDGNVVSGDGCSATCWSEAGWECGVPGRSCTQIAFCGDGRLNLVLDETCDDGNTIPGDGCSSTCTIEPDFACPVTGSACVSTEVCGDGVVTGSEQCDDGRSRDGDGCSSSCQIEAGWECPTPGASCGAERCGDGVRAGAERCDDGNVDDGDGCSSACRAEAGWICGESGATSICRHTVCGDGVREGAEGCDDGNRVDGDGCTASCEAEPSCPTMPGPCLSACGDGVILPGDGEECDDGNRNDGDGCSEHCRIEAGFDCERISTQSSEILEVPVTFRDFIAVPGDGAVRHPDFEVFAGRGPTPGLVEPVLDEEGKPIYTGACEVGNLRGPCPFQAQTTSRANFDEWYRDVPGVNTSVVTTLRMTRHDGAYYYPAPPPTRAQLFPLDDAGFVLGPNPRERRGWDKTGGRHNFGFTSEVRYWFEFRGGETLAFSGDDDVWIFINRQLALDLGGLHPQVTGTVVLDGAMAARLGLEVGRLYEVAMFHAERHQPESNFNLTLAGFAHARTECTSVCGDGVVTAGEDCDDGVNDGRYGGCLPGCRRGPRCGDQVVQSPPEACDDGRNLMTYGGLTRQCGPGCQWAPYCGDGVTSNGEFCDEGPLNGRGYGHCTEVCTLGPRCGDGVLNGPEECDDGPRNGQSGGLCTASCHLRCVCEPGGGEGPFDDQ